MKEVEPKDTRMKEFRSLLREWHPDKHAAKPQAEQEQAQEHFKQR